LPEVDRRIRGFIDAKKPSLAAGLLRFVTAISSSRRPERPNAARLPEDHRLPDMRRIVVAVDPSGARSANDEGADSIGIVVIGKGVDDHAYVLEDATCKDSPAGWGRRAVAAYHKRRADRIIAEQNFGGAMCEHVIRTIQMSRFARLWRRAGKSPGVRPQGEQGFGQSARKVVLDGVERVRELRADAANAHDNDNRNQRSDQSVFDGGRSGLVLTKRARKYFII